MIDLMVFPLKEIDVNLEDERFMLSHRNRLSVWRIHYLNQLYQKNIDIQINHYGKPYTLTPNIFFNTSHSHRYYAFIHSATIQDIGVDIEEIHRHVFMQRLAQAKFHPDEYQTWQQSDYDRALFFKIWTIKEAILKAHGIGIRIALNRLNTQIHPTWDFGVVQHEQLGNFGYQCFTWLDSAVCVAYPWNNEIVPIKWISCLKEQ